MENLKQSDLITFCRNQLSKLPVKKILLAYSGGQDSSALLDCLHKVSQDKSISLRTIHVNHGLSSDAINFEQHCKVITEQLNIPHETIMIHIDSSSNIEERCRLKRYEALVKSCQNDEVIFTGHHEEDQVETFLLRLIRGSGARGLSSMKMLSWYDEKMIFRPFLNVSKSRIDEYCSENKIFFVQDLSNNNIHFDRNFIRTKIAPMLKTRWPSFNKNIINNINIQNIQSHFITDSVRKILCTLYLNDKNKLSVSKLNEEETYNKIMIIHEWVFMQSSVSLNLKQILEILKILETNNDSNPLFSLNKIKVTKKRDILEISITKS